MSRRGFVIGDRILGQAADSHADWCLGYGSLGAYRVVGASAVGHRHLEQGRVRDDAFAIRTADDWLAVAVSDGVGSRPQSRYGSSFAVEALCEHLLRGVMNSIAQMTETKSTAQETRLQKVKEGVKEGGRRLIERLMDTTPEPLATNATPLVTFPDMPPLSDEALSDSGTHTWYRAALSENRSKQSSRSNNQATQSKPSQPPLAGRKQLIHDAFQKTHKGLLQYAQQRGFSGRDLSCTLLGLLLNSQTGEIVVGHLGDGAALAKLPKGADWLVQPAIPTGGGGETYVLTQADWEKHLSSAHFLAPQGSQISTLYLMSDGVANDYTYPPPPDILQRWTSDMDREIRKEIPLPQTAARLMHWLAHYESPSNRDDRTLVVIWR